MSASGVLVLIMVLLTSYWMIPLLFGQEYASSVLILNILAISIPMIYLAFNAGSVLTTKDNMRKKVKYMGYTAALNIVLNIVLIPIYSGVGAAMATVISNSALLYLYIMSVNKYVFSNQE
jgi:O-antigen/teichoic acid export membrane protein